MRERVSKTETHEPNDPNKRNSIYDNATAKAKYEHAKTGKKAAQKLKETKRAKGKERAIENNTNNNQNNGPSHEKRVSVVEIKRKR